MIFKIRDTKSHQAMPIPDGSHTVGREEHNYICIPDQSVSRRHAQIINSPDGLFIEDLGSSNGTAVRGEFITQRTPVNIGDVVFFGSASFRVEPEVTSDGSSTAAPGAGTKQPESKPAPGLKPVVSSIQFAKASIPLPATPRELPEGEMAVVEGGSETVAAGATLQLPKLNQLPTRSPAPATPPAPQPLPTSLGGSPNEPSRSVNFPTPAPLPGSSPAETAESQGMFSTTSIIAFLVGLGIGLVVGMFVLAKHFA